MRRLCPLLTLALFLGACAAPPILMTPSPRRFHNYELGMALRATVGEPFVQLESAMAWEAFEVARTYQPPGRGIQRSPTPVWHAGKLLPIVAESANRLQPELFLADEETGFWVSVYPNGHILRGWVSVGGSGFLQGSWEVAGILRRSDEPYRSPEGSFKAELIYSGIEGSTLRVMYREYSEDMARPAFSQDLRYDLEENRTVTFRSLQIEVIEATNSALEFRVLSDGGLPWLPRVGSSPFPSS